VRGGQQEVQGRLGHGVRSRENENLFFDLCALKRL
jgi:hypothetical protein